MSRHYQVKLRQGGVSRSGSGSNSRSRERVTNNDQKSSSGNMLLRNNISDSNLQTTKNNYSSMALDNTLDSGQNGAGVLSNRSSIAKFLKQEDYARRKQVTSNSI